MTASPSQASGTGSRAVPSTAETAAAIRAGDRRALARAITMIESTRPDHRARAEDLMAELLPHTGKSVRIGISGVPGVGKSTFIETFGLHVIGQGHRIAVLAVDPSSQRTGGSILGDKTRMEELTRNHSAFIRPSPSGGTLGGVARRTREAMLACEAAGYDVVVVETVGVGQSETAVSDMVDLFMLLLLPGGGDELQGIKKGIVELADLIVVNKADGALVDAARHAVAEYRHALALLRQPSKDWKVPVLTCSAATGVGVPEVWETVGRYRATLAASGALDARRAEQARAWMWSEIAETLTDAFRRHPAVRADLTGAERAVTRGDATPTAAARGLLEKFLGTRTGG
jgi:LAO/AO transport system kinase